MSSRPKSLVMPVLKALGSLRFAITLLAGLAALLTVSTCLESAYGTPFAQKTFYTARWFDAFLGLFWVNIFCATWTRFPFKKHHTGFVVTHVGILTLLIGALMTRVWGVEGTMTLFEGEKKSSIALEGHSLEVAHGGGTRTFPLKEGKTKYPYALGGEGAGLRVLGVTHRAAEKRVVTEGGAQDAPNAAVLVSLTSGMLGVDETFWLVEHDPADPDSHVREMGPAHLELRRKNTGAGGATLRIAQTSSEGKAEIPLSAETAQDAPIPGTDLTVKNIRYYPHAKIESGKIVDAPADIRFNPAVEFEVSDPSGDTEKHTRFFLFPHFSSLRGGEKADVFGLAVTLDAELPDEMNPIPTPSFVFFASDAGWSTRVASSRKEPVEAPLKIGDKVTPGWMDITIEAKQTLDRARVSFAVEENPSAEKALFAVRVAPPRGEAVWLLEGQKAEFGGARVRLRGEEKELPFELGLKDFRKIDYPGTSSPASFESDVVLLDAKEGAMLGKTIKMNKPLDYAGWRVFQSSYVQDERFGEASVFSIAKNPGIGLIYGGAAVLFTGVVLLFYLHPFFSPEARVALKKKTKGAPHHAASAR